MDWRVIWENMGYMLGGFSLALELTFIALFGGLLLGTVLSLGRLSSRRWIYRPAFLYVNFILSQPLILVIFWLYFLAPVFVGRPLGAFQSTAVAFIALEAAYFAFRVQRYVILPRALRYMVPALTTRTVIIFQGTSLAYVVGLREFLRRVDLVDTRGARSIELCLFAALVYLILCWAGSFAAHRLEKRR
jgi:glutamate/aspartate transport system permease protein